MRYRLLSQSSSTRVPSQSFGRREPVQQNHSLVQVTESHEVGEVEGPQRNAALPGSLLFYNHHRAHLFIGGTPPASRPTDVVEHQI